MKTLLQTKWMSAILLLISLALIFNPFIKFPYAFVVIVLFVLGVTYLRDGNFKELNFNRFGIRQLGIAVVVYVFMELFIDFLFQPFINWAFDEPADYSMFEPLKGNARAYLDFMWKMWVSAAIGEEILFRGFAFAQLKKIFGENHSWIFIPISSLLFAFPHFYQGLSGVVLTFLIGLGFGYVYWKYKNIWINILIHGLIDTVFLTLAYLGYLDFYEMTW